METMEEYIEQLERYIRNNCGKTHSWDDDHCINCGGCPISYWLEVKRSIKIKQNGGIVDG